MASSGVEQELLKHQQSLQVQTELFKNMIKLTGTCWDKCLDKPRESFSRKEQTCFENCPDRYFDTLKTIHEGLASRQQQQY